MNISNPDSTHLVLARLLCQREFSAFSVDQTSMSGSGTSLLWRARFDISPNMRFVLAGSIVSIKIGTMDLCRLSFFLRHRQRIDLCVFFFLLYFYSGKVRGLDLGWSGSHVISQTFILGLSLFLLFIFLYLQVRFVVVVFFCFLFHSCQRLYLFSCSYSSPDPLFQD